jgi:hypothetical protein
MSKQSKSLAGKIADLQARITHARALRIEAMRLGPRGKATVDALDTELGRLGGKLRAAAHAAADRHDVAALRILPGPEAAQALRDAQASRTTR